MKLKQFSKAEICMTCEQLLYVLESVDAIPMKTVVCRGDYRCL